MQTKFIWVLAFAAALLALHVAPGAAAAGSPVPPECKASDLSAADQARCDFIARTPDICQRQGLSEDTRRWCDETRFADELVPPECQEPDLSAADQARCDFIARTPNICQRQGLSEHTQRWCDQRRFAGEPHFTKVRLARNGAVRSIHLIVTETGQEVFTSYPYGVEFARPHDDDRVVRMKSAELDGMLEGRPTPAGSTPAPSGFATGLPIGWNNTSVPPLGVTPGQCLNYTINTPSNYQEQSDFQLVHGRRQHLGADQRLVHGERRGGSVQSLEHLLVQRSVAELDQLDHPILQCLMRSIRSRRACRRATR